MTGLSNGFVCLMGIGTVFIGLICIVFICKLQSVILKAFSKPQQNKGGIAAASASTPMLTGKEKTKIVAGVCACIAEELGTDASNIKVLSFKKV